MSRNLIFGKKFRTNDSYEIFCVIDNNKRTYELVYENELKGVFMDSKSAIEKGEEIHISLFGEDY